MAALPQTQSFELTTKGGNQQALHVNSVSTLAKSPLPTQNRQLSEQNIWLSVEEGGNLTGHNRRYGRRAEMDDW